MLKCSYIILISNNESTVARVIESLKKINGNFLREFIIIDDGSTDNSLSIIKNAVKDLPRTTIITHSQSGPALSINKAISLANGDYVQFMNGKEIISSDATALLIDCCQKMETQVAFSVNNKFYKNQDDIKNKLVNHPLKEILINKINGIRNIGLPGSLVSLKLLEKIQGADINVYNHNMSLSLKCAKYSKFAFLSKKKIISEEGIDSNKKNLNFESYNNLLSLHNFAKAEPHLTEEYLLEFIYALGNESRPYSTKIFYYFRYLSSKYIKKASKEEVFSWYTQEISKLF